MIKTTTDNTMIELATKLKSIGYAFTAWRLLEAYCDRDWTALKQSLQGIYDEAVSLRCRLHDERGEEWDAVSQLTLRLGWDVFGAGSIRIGDPRFPGMIRDLLADVVRLS